MCLVFIKVFLVLPVIMQFGTSAETFKMLCFLTNAWCKVLCNTACDVSAKGWLHTQPSADTSLDLPALDPAYTRLLLIYTSVAC
jgi:hypothetical protein